jgi:hypothetical protein
MTKVGKFKRAIVIALVALAGMGSKAGAASAAARRPASRRGRLSSPRKQGEGQRLCGRSLHGDKVFYVNHRGGSWPEELPFVARTVSR